MRYHVLQRYYDGGEGGGEGGVESPPHPPLVILTEKACVDEG